MFKKLISCLSSNSKRVLTALLSQDESVSAQHLADALNLSISQVRYSIKKIQACLAFNDVEIQQKPNDGVFINISKNEKSKLLDMIQNFQDDFSTLNQKERVRLLLQLILMSGIDLTQVEIREMTGISYTSFYRDIEKVRSWLNSFSLTLTAKRNAPFHLLGDELRIREAIQEILFQNLGQDFLIQACVLPVEDIDLVDIERSIFFSKIHNSIKEIDLPDCECQIRKLETKYRTNLFDRTHIELTLYLGIMKLRIKAGKMIHNDFKKIEDIPDGYIRDAARIIQSTFSEAELSTLEQEKFYLANLLSQCFLHGANDHSVQSFKSSNKGKYKELAKTIVKEIAKYLHAGLYEDNELTNCVEWELAHSPPAKDTDTSIKTDASTYKHIANSTEQILVKILTPILAANQMDNVHGVIGAISNHTLAALERVRSLSFQRRVLLVCGAGIATAFSLRSQLNTLFPEIDIVDMVSVFELAHDTHLLEGCDAIISTVPLGNITPIPHIRVNSLLAEDDIRNIKNTLGLDTQHRYLAASELATHQFNFKEILDKNAIRTNVIAKLPSEVIDEVGRLLLEIDAIWPSYIKAMKNLYSLYGPYMVIAPNTALLHAGPEMGSKKLAISLITLNQPISFGHKVYDPVKIALAFSSPVNSVHTNTLTHVFNFFASAESRLKITGAANPEEVLKILEASEPESAAVSVN